MKTIKAKRGQVVSKKDKKAHAALRKLRKSGSRGRQWSSVA